MRLLVADDDPQLGELLALALRREGHVVEVAVRGEDALWLATEFDFDVVVLDWQMPDLEGVDVCRELRARERWMPIIMLTANREVPQRVAGLQAGADDYLTKPFAVEELSARLQALVRRSPHERPVVLQVGDLVLDPAARRAERAGRDLGLRPKELALLELLMRRPGEAVSRAEILDQAWDINFDGMSNVVDAHVKALRAKVDKPFGTACIETVWGVGYRLVAAPLPA
ncbi:MAG: response regulator transcription factor [Acidimicrobiales bacterium]